MASEAVALSLNPNYNWPTTTKTDRQIMIRSTTIQCLFLHVLCWCRCWCCFVHSFPLDFARPFKSYLYASDRFNFMSVCVYVHACFPPHSLCAHLSICLCLLTQIGIQEHRQKENGRRRKKNISLFGAHTKCNQNEMDMHGQKRRTRDRKRVRERSKNGRWQTAKQRSNVRNPMWSKCI